MNGVELFIAGIEKLGLGFRQVGNIVVVTMDVAPAGLPGPHEVGADPPTDFPNVPPHWLHVPVELVLPEGKPRASELGDVWHKWSRQHPNWRAALGVPGWVAHARSLLLTAVKA